MDNCIMCGRDKSFLAGTPELCLSCFDELQANSAPVLARIIGELAAKHERIVGNNTDEMSEKSSEGS